MTRARKVAAISLLLTALAGAIVFAVYLTFIAGATGGPDLISAIASGSLSAKSGSSIEVIEPTIGYMPFTAKQYANLRRRKVIDSSATIQRLLSLLVVSQPGRIQQNHPSTSYSAYVKVNSGDGFYWLYCQVLEDRETSVLDLSANTRNATNPNGASTYYLAHFSELLAILKNDRITEPDGAANGSQPNRLETNRTSLAAGSRR